MTSVISAAQDNILNKIQKHFLIHKMKIRIHTILLILCALVSSSCIKEKLEVTYNKQEDSISSYIDSAIGKDAGYTAVNNAGSNRLTLVQGEGEELKNDGYITFYYAGYIFEGSVSPANLFATNRQASADDAGWDLTESNYEALTINLAEDKLLPGLKNGLAGVKAGEECEILFSGKYGFGNHTFGMIPANSALLYKIWVIGVSND